MEADWTIQPLSKVIFNVDSHFFHVTYEMAAPTDTSRPELHFLPWCLNGEQDIASRYAASFTISAKGSCGTAEEATFTTPVNFPAKGRTVSLGMAFAGCLAGSAELPPPMNLGRWFAVRRPDGGDYNGDRVINFKIEVSFKKTH